jgi:hypothetical protein
MKKLSFILIVILTITSIKGQNYINFPTSNTVWNYMCSNPGGEYHISQEIIGDTIINNLVYTKIKQVIFGSSNSNHYLIETNKKIMCYDKTTSSDFILYNFNLNIGDTFAIHNQYDTLVVIDIDSVILDDEKYHKKIELYHLNEFFNETWIEGIGSNNFPINFYGNWETSGQLTCYIVEDKILINNWCFYTDINKPKIGNKNLLKSNLINRDIVLECQKNEFERVEIFNSNGQIVLHSSIINDNFKIDFSNYSNGIYVLKIIGKTKIEFEKFIKF